MREGVLRNTKSQSDGNRNRGKKKKRSDHILFTDKEGVTSDNLDRRIRKKRRLFTFLARKGRRAITSPGRGERKEQTTSPLDLVKKEKEKGAAWTRKGKKESKGTRACSFREGKGKEKKRAPFASNLCQHRREKKKGDKAALISLKSLLIFI